MTEQEPRYEAWRDEYEAREGHAFPGRLEVWQAAEAPLLARIAEMKSALRKIAAIENKMVGGDWDEIEEARQIANVAIAAKGEPNE